MKKTISIIIAVVAVLAIVTAGVLMYPYDPTNPPTLPKESLENSTTEGIRAVIDANNQFAFDLYPYVQEGNAFYSPYSISAALAMTYEGARGQTASEMQEVFHFPENMAPNFAAVYNDINKGSDQFELRTGNALWAEQTYEFRPEYMQKVESYYGGKAVNLDFKNDSENSRQTINSFIEDQTNDKIKNLLPQGVIKPSTRLVLTNAIYFKGDWELEFDEDNTEEREFYLSPDDPVMVDMMYMNPDEEEFNYGENDDMQIIELPYKGEKLSMLIVLPKETLDDIEVSYENLQTYKDTMSPSIISRIYLPKFEFEKKAMLSDILKVMGMPTAFSGNADFSGMDPLDSLMISEVIHQAYVKVDEKGTEAAAATAVVMVEKSSVMPSITPPTFKADHPFLFFIQDKETGNILFMGRMTDPRE